MNSTGQSLPIKVESAQVQSMFGSIAHGYDRTNTILSFGMHHYWKYLVARCVPSNAKQVLDVCTGTGDLLPLIAGRGSEVIGVDFSRPMMEVGRKRFQDKFQFVQADALKLPFNAGRFDALTVAFGVRNLENLDAGLAEFARVLRPDGTLIVLEFGQPKYAVFRALYQWYSKVIMPFLGGLLTGNRAAYEYLPETASKFPCGAAFEERLRAAGFLPIRTQALTLGIAYLYEARRR